MGAAGFSLTGGAATAGFGGTGGATGAGGATVAGVTIRGGTGGTGAETGGAAGNVDAAGAAVFCAGMAGFAAAGGCATGRAGGAAASFCWVIAFSTSPGREICERSILVLISSSPRTERAAVFAAAAGASEEPRRYCRTFSASCSSRELECVFFSVTPTIGSTSRMALLLTSSSLARSLIRTLLIRPFLYPAFA